MEFTAESRCFARNTWSPSTSFRTAWASSNVPPIGMAKTLSAPVQAIWRSCSGEILPSGYRMNTAAPGLPSRPWMAAAPVSPEVAPRALIVSLRTPHWNS